MRPVLKVSFFWFVRLIAGLGTHLVGFSAVNAWVRPGMTHGMALDQAFMMSLRAFSPYEFREPVSYVIFFLLPVLAVIWLLRKRLWVALAACFAVGMLTGWANVSGYD